MSDQTSDNRPAPRRGLSALFLLLGLVIGGGAMAMLAPRETAPPPAPQVSIPAEITQAIHDLQVGQQKTAEQLQAIQQAMTTDQNNAKQLSSQVTTISDKLATVSDKVATASDNMEALRQSFASQQVPPANRRGRTR
jgi:septal ring factor EnvC (AmiA/AmiB activator)